MKTLILALAVLILSGCLGLPHKGQHRTIGQDKKCERLGDVALAMYGGGALIGIGGFAYGAITRDKTGFVIFGGGWVSGMTGLGILYYMQTFTGCQMP